MVDPARCKLWEKHNRRYDLLNENRCEDLIEGFKSMGKQEFAAIVVSILKMPKIKANSIIAYCALPLLFGVLD